VNLAFVNGPAQHSCSPPNLLSLSLAASVRPSLRLSLAPAGGFGDRGVEGKIQAIKYAREARKPFFGICLGMQCAVIEYARSKLGLSGANSAEFNPSAAHKVIVFMPEISTTHMGGTMRLGARPTVLRAKAPRAAAAAAVDGAAPAAAAASPEDDRTLAAELYGRDVKGAFHSVAGRRGGGRERGRGRVGAWGACGNTKGRWWI